MKAKHLVLGAAAVLVVVIAGAAAWKYWPRGIEVVEYPMPVATDIPTTVAVGPKGEIWFTIDFGNAVGLIRDGKLQRITKPGTNVEPIGLAVDASGVAWFTDAAALAVARIAPDGQFTAFTLGTPIARLARLATAPDGGVWFAEATGYSFTCLKDGALTRHTIESLRGGPYGVAVAPDGTVWGTLQAGNQLVRIGAAGEMTEHELPSASSSPTDVTVDRDGNVWVVEFRANKIARFADGKFTEYALPDSKRAISGIAAAPDGAIWFGLVASASLGRLNNAGEMRFFALPRRDARPYSVAVDAKGNVWYADIKGFVGMIPSSAVR